MHNLNTSLCRGDRTEALLVWYSEHPDMWIGRWHYFAIHAGYSTDLIRYGCFFGKKKRLKNLIPLSPEKYSRGLSVDHRTQHGVFPSYAFEKFQPNHGCSRRIGLSVYLFIGLSVYLFIGISVYLIIYVFEGDHVLLVVIKRPCRASGKVSKMMSFSNDGISPFPPSREGKAPGTWHRLTAGLYINLPDFLPN